MPTIYELDCSWINEAVSEVSTVAVWSVWDCVAKKWANSPKVTLRNILLSGLHQDMGRERFCIGEIPQNSKNAALLNSFSNKADRYELDLASNSRNHGRFTFNLAPVGKEYYGANKSEQWKRVIYGSILHTGCKHLVGADFKYVVVDDTLRNNLGVPQDDPVNKRHWGSGDSHAKGSAYFMELLGAGTVEIEEDGERDITIPLQFRIAAFKKWVAKGTIAYNPDLDDSPYDLVIPWSSLKGNKPALGNYSDRLLCGLVFEAETRRAKAGWMLFQWFDYETLEQDKIITRLIVKCEKLAAARSSIQELASLLRIDQSEAKQESKQDESGLQSEAEYVNTAMEAIENDTRGKLLLHPYITDKVIERLAKMWLNFAKAAGVRFWSLMSQPDPYLEKYELTDNKGKTTFTEKVFCAPSMKTGEYIVFCNPMRHWGDCQLWMNKHEGTYVNGSGLMAGSTKLMLSLGRDFDGDFVQLIASKEYPGLRAAIANFSKPPAVKKFSKRSLPGTLQQVAINSMTDKTGIVASLLGRARAAGAENIPLLIPPGDGEKLDLKNGETLEPKQMAIINFLSQELQIAVDSLKSSYPNNDPGLKVVTDYLNTLGDVGQVPWLKGFKDDAVYKTKPCPVSETAPDTVSQLVRLVNSYWQAANFETNLHLNSFRQSLFANYHVTEEQQEYAFEQRNQYARDMEVAIQWKLANDGDTRKIREVTANHQAMRDRVIAKLTKPDGELFSIDTWAAAYWRVVHTVKEDSRGKGSLVFNLFAEQIMKELREGAEAPSFVEVYGVHREVPNHWSKKKWTGERVQVRIVLRTSMGGTGVEKMAVDMIHPESSYVGFFPLGFVADKDRSQVAIGETRTMIIWTGLGSTYGDADFPSKKVWLFDPAKMTEAEITSKIEDGRKKKKKVIYQPEDFGLPPE